MSYSDQKFITRNYEPIALNTQGGTSTATASGHAPTTTAVIRLPKTVRATAVTGVKVAIDTAPAAAVGNGKMVFKNGTSTFAVATIGTNTAGVYVDATVTASNGTLTAGAQPTVDFNGTATASANTANGNYSIYWETNEVFS